MVLCLWVIWDVSSYLSAPSQFYLFCLLPYSYDFLCSSSDSMICLRYRNVSMVISIGKKKKIILMCRKPSWSSALTSLPGPTLPSVYQLVNGITVLQFLCIFLSLLFCHSHNNHSPALISYQQISLDYVPSFCSESLPLLRLSYLERCCSVIVSFF